MNKPNWWAIASLVLLVALVLSALSTLVGEVWWAYSPERERESGSDWGRWRCGTDDNWWIRQITFLPFRCLMPALFITLLVLGVVWLVKAISTPPSRGAGMPTAAVACPGCGRPVQAGWRVCPYCERKLS